MSAEDWRSSWVFQKSKVALALHAGAGGAGYGEAVLVLCAALSAIAADAWPGRRIDRLRFAELLSKFGSQDPPATTISIPILIQSLGDEGRIWDAEILEQNFLSFDQSRVLVWADVDKTEQQVLLACPSISRAEVRACSYAALLYQEIRSAYAHEYKPGEQADSGPMSSRTNPRVSYVNRLEDKHTRRLIHFHIEWLAELTSSIANNLQEVVTPLPFPESWWLTAVSRRNAGCRHDDAITVCRPLMNSGAKFGAK